MASKDNKNSLSKWQPKVVRSDTRRILRSCRLCEMLLFCSEGTCPVCNGIIQPLSEKQGDLEFATIESLSKRFRGLSKSALERSLERSQPKDRVRFRFANVKPDRYLPHFFSHSERIGVCNFCTVIQVRQGKCRVCGRNLRFYLAPADLLGPLDLNLAEISRQYKEYLAKRDLGTDAVLAMARIHIINTYLGKKGRPVELQDLLIKFHLGDPRVFQFLEDTEKYFKSLTIDDFERQILPFELKQAKISVKYLLWVWSWNLDLKSIWGDYAPESAKEAMMKLFLTANNQFAAGLKIARRVSEAEKKAKAKERQLKLHEARLEEYRVQKATIRPPTEVSDWWLDAPESPLTQKGPAPYVSRSWKNRWRRPW